MGVKFKWFTSMSSIKPTGSNNDKPCTFSLFSNNIDLQGLVSIRMGYLPCSLKSLNLFSKALLF